MSGAPDNGFDAPQRKVRRDDIEASLTNLQRSLLLDADEKQQFGRLVELLASGHQADLSIVANTLDALKAVVEERKRGRANQALAPAVTGAVASLQSEREGAQKVARSSLWLLWVVVIGAMGTGAVMLLKLFTQDSASFVAAGVLDLTLYFVLAVSLVTIVGRLFQLARESAEKMDVRSVSIRFIVEGIAQQQANGDTTLLKAALKIWPPANTNAIAQPIGRKDLASMLKAIVRVGKNSKGKKTQVKNSKNTNDEYPTGAGNSASREPDPTISCPTLDLVV